MIFRTLCTSKSDTIRFLVLCHQCEYGESDKAQHMIVFTVDEMIAICFVGLYTEAWVRRVRSSCDIGWYGWLYSMVRC